MIFIKNKKLLISMLVISIFFLFILIEARYALNFLIIQGEVYASRQTANYCVLTTLQFRLFDYFEKNGAYPEKNIIMSQFTGRKVDFSRECGAMISLKNDGIYIGEYKFYYRKLREGGVFLGFGELQLSSSYSLNCIKIVANFKMDC